MKQARDKQNDVSKYSVLLRVGVILSGVSIGVLLGVLLRTNWGSASTRSKSLTVLLALVIIGLSLGVFLRAKHEQESEKKA